MDKKQDPFESWPVLADEPVIIGEGFDTDLRQPGSDHINGFLAEFGSSSDNKSILIPGYGEIPSGDIEFEPHNIAGMLIARIKDKTDGLGREKLLIIGLGVALTSIAGIHLYRRSKNK